MKQSIDELSINYADKVLGIRLYQHSKNEFTVDDFLDKDTLVEFVNELENCESDITPAGKAFLEKYYGWKQLAKFIGASDRDEVEDLARFLELKRPMEILTFIEEGRESITQASKPKSNLLPPQDDI